MHISNLKWILFVLLLGLSLSGCATLAGIPSEDVNESAVGSEETGNGVAMGNEGTDNDAAAGREDTGNDAGVASNEIESEPEYTIVTLLPKDAIPSIDNPQFYGVEEADEEYDPNEIVMGVIFNGEARAYSVNMLSSHEIVNDMVSGVPIAVTW